MIIKPITTPNFTGNDNVAQLQIHTIDEEQGVIIADCYDVDGNLVALNAWFVYKGADKNVDFTLTKAEITAIKEVSNG